MTKKLVLAVLLLVCGWAFGAQAEDELLSPEFYACLEPPVGMTTQGMVACMGAERALHDAKLNAAYQQLMTELPEDRREALKEAQRAWIKFRDAYADFLYDPNGGTMVRITTAHWLMQSTAMQARELEFLLDSEN